MRSTVIALTACLLWVLAEAPLNAQQISLLSSSNTQVLSNEVSPKEESPYKGWQYGFNLGQNIWGNNSFCACNPISFEIFGGYEGAKGFGAAMQMELTESSEIIINHQLELNYFPPFMGSMSRRIGITGAIGWLIPLSQSGAVQAYSGNSRSLGAQFRFPLNRRKNTMLRFSFGVQSMVDHLDIEDGFWNPRTSQWQTSLLSRRIVQTGPRLAIGLSW